MQKPALLAVLLLSLTGLVHAQIPMAEREALVALYNSTDGANWLENNSWLGPVGTECLWYGVDCSGGHVEELSLTNNNLNGVIPAELGNLSSLLFLWLNSNELSGSIPAELGDLSILRRLQVNSNQLSGTIPAELGNLSNCSSLHLESNRLSGVIPAGLGNMSSLRALRLDFNELSGSIPPELGDISGLEWLWLNSNRLSGDIPAELGDLAALGNGQGLDLRWNALYSDNATLVFFLNAKQRDGYDWQSTQTISPENLSVDRVGDHSVWLSWDAVTYLSDPGGYSVFSAPTGTGTWTPGGWTEGKDVVTFPVTGLNPGTTYDFAAIAYTDPHADNLNLVNSDFSPEVMATTAWVGCAQPVIEIEWGSPITLSLSASYDSYLWITGETTPTIDIAPLFDQWYWVTVTSAGPCEEAASIWVDPSTLIFFDGFESGDTGAWSVLVPRCSDLTVLQCMNSAECTFTSEYTCRPAEGPCESNFRQGLDSAESCEAKEDCSYDPGFCFCPPGMWCFCGGGPPPGCWDS